MCKCIMGGTIWNNVERPVVAIVHFLVIFARYTRTYLIDIVTRDYCTMHPKRKVTAHHIILLPPSIDVVLALKQRTRNKVTQMIVNPYIIYIVDAHSLLLQ